MGGRDLCEVGTFLTPSHFSQSILQWVKLGLYTLYAEKSFFTGADITDYFNYGFTEDTWKQYCEKQRRMRMELQMPKKIFVSSHLLFPWF